MSILLIAPLREMKPWQDAIRKIDSTIEVEIYPEVSDPHKISAAILWNHPEGILANYPNLKWICSLGAGVDHILKDKNIPNDLRVTRVVDPGIPNEMARMIIAVLTEFEKGIFRYWELMKLQKWEPNLEVPKLNIGLMGMGAIGRKVADSLALLGYKVTGLSLHGNPYKDFKLFHLEELNKFLEINNVFICLLPLTAQTKKIVNHKFFEKLHPGSYFMNLARGGIVDEEALLRAVEKRIVKAAYLDVFENEPLPSTHPFWKRPEIIITPHISGITDVHTAAKQIVDNYHTFEKSGDLKFEINKQIGY